MSRGPAWPAFVLSLLLVPAVPRAEAAAPVPPSALAPAPAAPADLSVEDLGFSAGETKGDAVLQAQLEKRTRMLKTHQLLGLATAVPLGAELLIGGDTASRVRRGSTNTALHVGLGIGTVVMYGATAAFAILAPKPKGVKNTGSTKLHRYLAYVHVPLMIAVPVLGQMANYRIQQGEPARGMKDWHSLAATSLAITYGAAMSIMVVNF